MNLRNWKSGLIIVFVLALMLTGIKQVEAAVPDLVGIEARMALDLTDKGNLPNTHVGGLASNGEFYLYAGYYGALYRSEDGLHWRNVYTTDQSKKYFTGIARQLIWDGTQFVMLLDNRILTSKDGRDWTNVTPAHPKSYKEYIFKDIVYANGQYIILAQDRDLNVSGFYMAGDNTIFVGNRLTELKQATKHDFSESMSRERPLDHLIWNGSMYLAGGNGSAYSYNGKDWYGNAGLFYGYNAAWDGSRAWEAYGTDIKATDSKGRTRKIIYSQPEGRKNNIRLSSLGYNGHSYIAAGRGKTDNSPTSVLYSKDGVRWSSIQLGAEASDTHTILPTPHGYLLAGDRIWFVSDIPIDRPSAWAAPVLKQEQAVTDILVPYAVKGLYQSSITRQDFSILSVKLYETLTGKWAEAPQANPFKDTVHSYVLKANKLGIINGVSATRFAPSASITRQEIALILFRTLQKAGLQLSTESAQWRDNYADLDRVAPYAAEALRFMNQEGIIGGRSVDRLDPTGTATREETIIMVDKLYERFKSQLEAYTGPGSVSRTLFVPEDINKKADVTVMHGAINLDGRLIWSGDEIKKGDSNSYYYVPLEEIAESLGITAKWDNNEYKLTLSTSKAAPDLANQTDSGISERDPAALQPRKDTAEPHVMRYQIGTKEMPSVIVLTYNNKLYVDIKWVIALLGG